MAAGNLNDLHRYTEAQGKDARYFLRESRILRLQQDSSHHRPKIAASILEVWYFHYFSISSQIIFCLL